ncbi:unnamed protein product [Cochlearia groenlandica]
MGEFCCDEDDPEKMNRLEAKFDDLDQGFNKILSSLAQILTKMDVLDRLEKRLTKQEERQASVTGKTIAGDTQTQASSTVELQEEEPAKEEEVVVEQIRSKAWESDKKMSVFDGEKAEISVSKIKHDASRNSTIKEVVSQKVAEEEDSFVLLENLFYGYQMGEDKGTDVETVESAHQVFDQMPVREKRNKNKRKKKRWKDLAEMVGSEFVFKLLGDKVLVGVLERKMNHEKQHGELKKKTNVKMKTHTHQVIHKRAKHWTWSHKTWTRWLRFHREKKRRTKMQHERKCMKHNMNTMKPKSQNMSAMQFCKRRNMVRAERVFKRFGRSSLSGKWYNKKTCVKLNMKDDKHRLQLMLFKSLCDVGRDRLSKRSHKRVLNSWILKYKLRQYSTAMKQLKVKHKWRFKEGFDNTFFGLSLRTSLVYWGKVYMLSYCLLMDLMICLLSHHLFDDMWLRTMWRKQIVKHKFRHKHKKKFEGENNGDCPWGCRTWLLRVSQRKKALKERNKVVVSKSFDWNLVLMLVIVTYVHGKPRKLKQKEFGRRTTKDLKKHRSNFIIVKGNPID